jgi:F-type H+-transporting ATPase subunit b
VTEHGAHAPSIADLLWPALNFLIFVALLVRFLRGPVIEYFRQRTERLRAALAAGARARAEAEDLRVKLAREVAELPQLRARLLADLRATAERERADMMQSAKQTAERIRTEARLLGEQEVVAARQALRLEVIDETVRQATAIIREALAPADHARLVREFIERTGAEG